MTPQCKTLLNHLNTAGSITNLEAITVHRIYALPRRISDLEEMGYRILRDHRKDVTGKRYVRYFLMGRN